NNLTVDIINNSYGKDYIALSENAYNDLVTAKSENYKVIYQNDAVNREYDDCIKPMFEQVYYKLLDELKRGDKNSFIFRHHIDFINSNVRYYGESKYSDEEPNDIVTDYIASMTDDYFLALYKELFPKSPLKIEFKSYFDDIK
ncbi:MAG TPA: phosphohydrolase, partial [Ruminococcaceae bacterium]|nr:phosphohydrolase [Oscillospiraceae bacterium]